MKKIEIKLPTGETREIEPSSESYIYRSVTDGNRLSLEWSEGVYRDYPVGLTAHVDGYDYTLYYPVEVRKVNTELLEYRATLHGREEELKMTKMKDVGSDTPLLSFVLTGKPTDFVRFVAKSMGEDWSVGQVIEGSERTLAFRHESCHDALARISEEYHTEWHVEGTAISLLRLEVGREQPVALSYGMGKGFRSGVGRRSDGEETPVGRLYVEGGKRNIDPSKYGALTLRLPKGATYEYRGVTYRTDPTGSYITGASGSRTEGSYDGADVYPRRVGRVTRVEVTKEGLVDIIDSTIPETLNYNDYRIGGEKAVIVFLSGMLTGREIEIEQTAKALSGYLHEERRFRLVSSEQDGQQMPGGSYMPKEGDTYAVYGISLPEEYVRTAEEELFHEACRYLSEEERERFRFDGQLDPVFAHREWGRIGGLIVPGGFVHFSDKQFYPRGRDIRIVSVRHPIGQPWAAELTLSDGPTSTGYLGSRLGRLEAEEILRRREEERRSRLQRQDYAQAVEAIGMISRAVKEVEGYTARIKPSVVETMGLLIGSEAGHFDFVEAVGSTKSVPFVPVVEAEAVVLPSSVLRHQTLGVKALTNKHRAEDFRYWTLPEYTSPALSDGTESYYIYAKVEREGSAGVFLLSREPISMEKVTGYYHLLVGTVSSVVDGSRAYARLYGYSMLTPGALTVGAIESGDGNMRIDLETGQIIVKHLRIGPPDASKDLQTELDTIRKTPGPQGLQGQQGPKGEDGIPGKDGLPGKDGKDGRSQYTHIAYADTAEGGGFSQSPAGKSYVGMYVDFTQQDSSDPSRYAWTLFKGADGADGLPGKPGKDGRTPYLHIAYADTAAGGGFSQSPDGKAYIGQYTDYTQPDSSDPSRYTWLRIKGEKGDPGKDVDPNVLNDLKTAVDDAKSKLDDTVTKAELDGVVSAQEQKDIQAAKAALDAAKKAYDDAVQRAKELDGEIQVGGRNLLPGSRSMNRLGWGTDLNGTENPFRTYEDQDGFRVIRLEREGAGKTNVDYWWCFLTDFLAFQLDKETYTMSFDYKSNYSGEHLSFGYWRKDGRGQSVKFNGPDSSTWRRGSITLDLTGNNLLDPSSENECIISIICGTSAGQYTEIRRIKLERGTVATDWTPAPEDVQAEIDAAKEQADKAQTSTDNLKGYVDGAFRDGVVDDAEAKAIKTYINEVDAQWQSALGAYEKVYTNPLLTGAAKTALLDCKTTLAGKVSELTSCITSAISDGKATKAEATETERLYNAYKGALRDFQKALKCAEEAIRDAGKTTGGRNLAVGCEKKVRLSSGILLVNLSEPLQKDTSYTLSFDVEVHTPPADRRFLVYLGYSTHLFTSGYVQYADGATHYSITLHTPDKEGEYSPDLRTAYLYPHGWRDGYSTVTDVTFSRVKLERGTVATDWTPAPEDVQAEIDKVERGYQKLIERVDVEFAVSTSRTTAPVSGWQTNAPTTTKGQALWQRTKVYLKDGTTEVRGTTCIQGRDGTDGGKGADGRGIANVKELYYLSTSNTELKGGAWSETAPTPREGCWIWTMTRIYYTTGTPTSTKPICVTGAKGDRGADGTSQYTNTWIDATGLDSDKYFPVTIYSSSNKRQYISLLNSLNGSVPPWSTHQNGFTVSVQWSTIGSGWGAIDITRSITNASYRFAKDGVVPVGDIGQVYETSEEYIYVRGAGKYFFTTSYEDGTPGSVPTLHPDGYEWKSGSYSRTLPVKASVTFPLTDSEVERKEREAEVAAVRSGLANTDTLVAALEKAQNKLDQGVLTKADTKDIQYLLDSLKNGDTQVAGGLVLSNDIILSDPNSKDVTATISGTQTEGAKVMRLGISYTCDPDKKTTVSGANSKWGVNLYSELQKLESDSDRIRKLDELGFPIVGGRSLGWPQWEICKAADAKEGGEATALANDGTGHLRDLYFGGEEIGFGPPDRRYMQIGGTARSEYDMVNASTEIHKSQVPGTTVYKAGETLLDNFYLPGSNSELKYTAMISARADAEAQRRIVVEGGGPDGNPHYGGGYERPKRVVYYDRCSVTTSAYLRVTITRGGEEVYSVTSPTVTASAVATGGRSADDSEITHDMRFDSGSQELAVTLTVPANIIRPSDFAKLTLVCSELRADRGGGGAAYASNIVSYLPYDTSTPMVSVTKDRAAFFYGRSRYLLFNYLSQYVVKLVGDMLLQGNLRLKGKLEAGEVDAPGAPLCGGMVYENGTFSKSFGRYVNKSWEARPRVEYDYDASTYTVYHSIGSSSYVPIVTAVGSNAGNERWNLSVRVYNVSPYRFEVKLLTNNDNPTQNGFSYVCFKAD